MIALLDTSVWLDFTRPRTPQRVRQFAADQVSHPSVHLAEPVVFELMRHALPGEVEALIEQFELIPLLATPVDLWQRAATLGRKCRQRGVSPGALDLLIAGVALAHQAVIVTFDSDFEAIGRAGNFPVKLLKRPIG